MLRGFTAAADIIVALPIVWLCKDHRGSAGGAANQAGNPVFVSAKGAPVILPGGLQLRDAGLGNVPGIHADQRLMLSVRQHNVGIREIPVGNAGGIPAKLADIDRVP
ncbi:hypothetical protein SDC9_71357 [bioreactor metagenome]|uniref:Uncharacterized protein n=1 Tax=bioreactor metagenome TaxID=1076179 RepID=A0A644Y980_9ZZZZ